MTHVASVTGVPSLEALAGRRRGAAQRGTDRMRVLLRELGSPHLPLRAAHVVGTDGKTSVVRMASSLLTAQGVAVGETTSPHLQQVSERIRLAGEVISPDRLAAACRHLPQALAAVDLEVGEPATFFESVTAVALRAFADARVDAAVVEAGIGGIDDATDVVPARVTVLTSVGLDHPELGTTLQAVAYEKAGTVVPGTTLLTGAQPPEVAEVVARVAAGCGATLLRAGHDFGVLTRRPVAAGQLLGLRGLGGSRVRVALPLRGAHQAANAALALATTQALLGTTDLDPARLRDGFATVSLPGRIERVRRDGAADVILDGAHDPDAMRALVAALGEQRHHGQVLVVLGTGAARDPWSLAEPLSGLASSFLVTAAASPTASPPEVLAARLAGLGHRAEIAADAVTALEAATRATRPDDLVVVTGSLHLVGDARTALGIPPP